MVLKGCEAVVTLAHDQIQVLRHHGFPKLREACGLSVGNIADNVFFYNNSMSVMMRALTERLYYVKSKDGFVDCPKPTVSFETLASFRKSILRNLPSLPPVWTDDEFVQSYTGSKRKRYQRAVENLVLRGARRSDGFWKTFIKAEFYNATNKNNPCPRLIQPRSPEYNVLIGRYLRPAEKLIYKSIDKTFKHHVVLKCDNPWQRAATIKQYWDEFEDPCFVGLDASRFDQHVSDQALEYEHSIYNAIFKCPALAEWLSWQIENIGYANLTDGAIRYTSSGVRGSGDMNTALGNVLLMCGITLHYLNSMDVKWRFINDGDDCGIFIDRENLNKLDDLPTHHLAYGFEMEVEKPVYQMEHIEFCQSRPINLGPAWMMVRNVHKAMLNDWINISAINYATLEELFVATGRCGLALYADVPVLSAMYMAMMQFTARESVVQRVLNEQFSGIGRTWRMFASEKRSFPVDETCARVSMYHAFGILPDAQVELEDQFRALNPSSQIPELKSFYVNPQEKIQYYI